MKNLTMMSTNGQSHELSSRFSPTIVCDIRNGLVSHILKKGQGPAVEYGQDTVMVSWLVSMIMCPLPGMLMALVQRTWRYGFL